MGVDTARTMKNKTLLASNSIVQEMVNRFLNSL